MLIEDMPINNVEWVDVNKLDANSYNPNVVLNAEMELLKLSILKNGWIQPILVNQDYIIIDGFHRASLAMSSESVNELTNGKVPCVVMNLSEPERMMLTIRINRAKGNHVAIKMSDIVHTLVYDYGISPEEVGRQIGAELDEIELLLRDNVFQKYNLKKTTKYSQAWIPRDNRKKKH